MHYLFKTGVITGKKKDVSKSYEGFVNIFNELYSIHFPMKNVCIINKAENGS